MAYFMINDIDFSHYVKSLKVKTSNSYNAQTNAAGDTVVDLINKKHEIEVGIIPLTETDMAPLLAAIDNFTVLISYRDPRTNELFQRMLCIIPEDEVDYYTIQINKVMYNELTLNFIEL